jgi:hypothetical protein
MGNRSASCDVGFTQPKLPFFQGLLKKRQRCCSPTTEFMGSAGPQRARHMRDPFSFHMRRGQVN